MNYSRSNFTLIVWDLKFLSQSTSWILFLFFNSLMIKLFCSVPLQLIRAIVHNDHQKVIFIFISVWSKFISYFYAYICITQNETKILGLTRQHKIAWKSGPKLILKFSPQADFNFVQPCVRHTDGLICVCSLCNQPEYTIIDWKSMSILMISIASPLWHGLI